MIYKNLVRLAGVLTFGAAALNIYIGLYDKNLSTYQPIHWDLNWLLVIAGIVAGIFLVGFPKKRWLVILGGILWPVIYVGSLAFDVYTKLCAGGNQTYCWPSKTAAFNYLIANNPNISGGYGWLLWTGTMPTILALLFISFVLSIIGVYMMAKRTPTPKPTLGTSSPTKPEPKTL